MHEAAGGSRILVVFRKEFREIFRDKRSLFNIVISPLLITPLILSLVGAMIKKQVSQAQTETVAVGVVGGDRAKAVVDAVRGAPNLTFESLTRQAADEAIRKRRLKAAVVLPEDADERLKAMRPITVTILIDQGSQSSMEAAKKLESVFTERGQNIVTERLKGKGLSPEMATPFATKEEPVPGSGSLAVMLLAGFLPYILAIYAIMGGVSPANDSVAGEKERGTLETLLVSPASRRDLVLGKFLAVASAALVSSVLSVTGLLLRYSSFADAFGATKGTWVLKAPEVAAMLLVMIPLAVLGAGLLLAISTYARNQKEAQTYLGPVLVLVSVAAMLSTFLKSDASLVYAVVPVLNAALVLKQALEHSFNAPFVVLACVTSLLYAGLALWFATRLFEKESVLLKV
jgi:sodium transport system permease protein